MQKCRAYTRVIQYSCCCLCQWQPGIYYRKILPSRLLHLSCQQNLRKCERSRRYLTGQVKTENARAEEANAEDTGAHKVKQEIMAHHTPFAKSRQADGLQSERTVIVESRERDFDIITGARIIERAAGTIGGRETAPDRAKSLQNWGYGSGKGDVWYCRNCNNYSTARFSVKCTSCNHQTCWLCR